MKRKRFLFLVGAVVLMGSISSPRSALAVACPDSVFYSTYLTLGAAGCTIGDKTFSNFAYEGSNVVNTVPVPASSVGVTTIGPAGSGATLLGPDIGFLFNPAAATMGGPGNNQQLIVQHLSFLAATTSGQPLIVDSVLTETSSVSVLGGNTDIIAQLCLGSTFPSCSGGIISNLQTFSGGALTPKFVDSTTFPAQSIVDVRTQILVNGGTTTGGSATVTGVRQTFSQTGVPEIPEPSTWLLLGSGLVWLIWRKYQNVTVR